jgi:hypothetical protein
MIAGHHSDEGNGVMATRPKANEGEGGAMRAIASDGDKKRSLNWSLLNWSRFRVQRSRSSSVREPGLHSPAPAFQTSGRAKSCHRPVIWPSKARPI